VLFGLPLDGYLGSFQGESEEVRQLLSKAYTVFKEVNKLVIQPLLRVLGI